MSAELAPTRGIRSAYLAATAVVYVLLTNISLIINSGGATNVFRSFGSGDQLSYLAFVTNVSRGISGNTEPFTEDGSVFYPRAYYIALGYISRYTGLTPAETWWIVGVGLQVVLVIAIGLVLQNFTNRAWPALLAIIPLTAGTFAQVFVGNWYWTLDSHAVLWGPFAPLFTLNGEATAMIMSCGAFLASLWAQQSSLPVRRKLVVYTVSAFAIGLTANVHTYGFLVSVFLLCYGVAAWIIFKRRLWILGIVSLLFVPVVYLIGPTLGANKGPLTAMVFGLLPAIPGLLVLFIRSRGIALIPFAGLGLGSTPTILATVLGIFHQDPFLVYRTASSSHLGVQALPGVLAAMTLAIPIGVMVWYGIREKAPAFIALPTSLIIAGAVLSTNDLWGANQEPYRFWIDSFFIIGAVLFPLGVFAATQLVRQKSSQRMAQLLIAAGLALYAIAGVDFYKFITDPGLTSSSALDSERIDALREISGELNGETVVLDSCINPLIFKNATGARTAFSNVGMAWPTYRTEIMNINILLGQQILDVPDMQKAGLSLVLADDSCGTEWMISAPDSTFTVVAQSSYSEGGFTLYRVH